MLQADTLIGSDSTNAVVRRSASAIPTLFSAQDLRKSPSFKTGCFGGPAAFAGFFALFSLENGMRSKGHQKRMYETFHWFMPLAECAKCNQHAERKDISPPLSHEHFSQHSLFTSAAPTAAGYKSKGLLQHHGT
jgi:hypothetical protein